MGVCLLVDAWTRWRCVMLDQHAIERRRRVISEEQSAPSLLSGVVQKQVIGARLGRVLRQGSHIVINTTAETTTCRSISVVELKCPSRNGHGPPVYKQFHHQRRP